MTWRSLAGSGSIFYAGLAAAFLLLRDYLPAALCVGTAYATYIWWSRETGYRRSIEGLSRATTHEDSGVRFAAYYLMAHPDEWIWTAKGPEVIKASQRPVMRSMAARVAAAVAAPEGGKGGKKC